jgi:TonB family protein
VNKPVYDIAQIEKYLAGKLDARAMHDLERRALDDPFLADALEGYDEAGNGREQSLAELSDRLQRRADKKVRVLSLRIQLSIAASFLVIIGAGLWFMLSNYREKPRPQVAVNVVTPDKPQQPSISMPAGTVPPTSDTNAATTHGSLKRRNPAGVSSEHAQPFARPSTLTKPDSSNYANVPAPQPLAAAKGEKTLESEYKSTTNNKAFAQSANDVIVQGLSDKKELAKKAPQGPPETQLIIPRADMDIRPGHNGNNNLVGYVTANNQPIVGAIVKLAGRDFGVVTDANGRFVMHDVPDNKSLVVKSLGYATKQLKVNGGDSVNVSLEPSVNSLSEVAIAKPFADAHPSEGWKSLTDYLDKNAISPDGQTGQVKLSFMVDGRGALTAFKVIQSLSPQADQKAIDLVTNGPGWAGNIDGQAHEVKLTVTFH